MKLIKITAEQKDNAVLLRTNKPGDVVRFYDDTLEEAFQEGLFYLVNEEEKNEQVKLTRLKDGLTLKRDGDRKVFKHAASLQIED